MNTPDLLAVLILAVFAPILAVLEVIAALLGMTANLLEGFGSISTDVFKRAFR